MYKYLYLNLRSQNFPYVNISLLQYTQQVAVFLLVIYRRLCQLTRSPFWLIASGVNFSFNSFSCYCFIQYLLLGIAWNNYCLYCLELILVYKSPVVSCIFIVGSCNVYVRIPQNDPVFSCIFIVGSCNVYTRIPVNAPRIPQNIYHVHGRSF